MKDPTQPTPRHFTGIYWLRSSLPISEIHDKKCRLRIHDGEIVREGIFMLEARAHCSLPEYHHVTASHAFIHSAGGVTTLITFDQHRADQITRSDEAPDDYSFVADIDIRRPLQYVPEIQDAVEKHLLEVLNELRA
jgi:hypothetical protein